MLNLYLVKGRKKNNPKKRKSEQSSADLSEYGRTYDIDRLNLDESANDSESESK